MCIKLQIKFLKNSFKFNFLNIFTIFGIFLKIKFIWRLYEFESDHCFSVCMLSVCVSVSVRSQVVCGKQWPLFGPLSTSREILNDFSSLPGREKLYRRYWQKKKQRPK